MKRGIIQAPNLEHMSRCSEFNSVYFDIEVYIEDPFELLAIDYQRTHVDEDNYIYKVELSHFLDQCLKGNPNYLYLFDEKLKNETVYVDHGFIDLIDVVNYLVSKELAKKVKKESENLLLKEKNCVALSVLRMANNMLDHGKIIIPEKLKFYRENWTKNIEDFEKKMKKSSIREATDKIEIKRIEKIIRKSLDYGI